MNSAKKAIDLLYASGYEAFLVGGCVRDALMGEEQNDFDVTTSALPNETLAVFSNYRTVPTGLKHGTVTVIIDGTPIEITTYRADGDYSDHRHPESVSFSRELKDDLCRRDFTVNAMAYNERVGLVDLYGGRQDIEKRIIRAVGDPDKRFDEDALRILRALRFASQKCFSIEPATANSAKKLANLLSFVSAERVFAELKKLLMGKGVLEVLLGYPEVITQIIPQLAPSVGFEQCNPHHVYNVYEHIAYTVHHAPFDEAVRLAALLHDIGKPETFSVKDGIGHFYGHTDASLRIAEQVLTALKCDNATKNEVLILIKYHDPVIEPTEKAVKRALSKLGKPTLLKLLDLKSADNLAQAPSCAKRLEGYEAIRDIISELEAKNSCFSLRDLKINGDTLISLGIPRGRDVGRILQTLLSEVIDGETENTEEALKNRALVLKG